MVVKRDYLNANIDYEIFVEQPKGFIVRNENNVKLV